MTAEIEARLRDSIDKALDMFLAVADDLKGERVAIADVVTLVAESMRGRGIAEAKISSIQSGMAWAMAFLAGGSQTKATSATGDN